MSVTEIDGEIAPSDGGAKWPARLERATLISLIGVLAWAPFPLGSNRPWSWSLLSILIALCCGLWALSQAIAPSSSSSSLKPYLVPATLFAGVLLWGAIQLFPYVPPSWPHPIWQVASDALQVKIKPIISIDPWRTATEWMKLLTYLAAGGLTFFLCQRSDQAKLLFSAILFIIALYAGYGLILALTGFSQTELFYENWTIPGNMNGPFVLRNSFATYLGMGVILATVHFYPAASKKIVTNRGTRQHILSTLLYVFGQGVWGVLAFIAVISVLLATASRAGCLATLIGLMTVLVLAAILSTRRNTSIWAMAGAASMVALAVLLFSLGGDTLESRFFDLVEAGGVDEVRMALWNAATRMISDSPWLGLGLGTFERAYPMYADRMFPFVMDKAHNDYLEFAAGIGLPAAIAWWTAIGWCAFLCLRGVFVRRRNRIYPMVAIGATVLIAVHSMFDFSLQIPAVALTYSVIMGLGLAQASSTRN